MKRFAAFLLLALGGCKNCNRDRVGEDEAKFRKSGGVVLSYRLEASGAAEECARVFRRRLYHAGCRNAEAVAVSGDSVRVRSDLRTADEVQRIRSILGRVGRLELRPVADSNAHKSWDGEPAHAPPGHTALANNDRRQPGEYAHLAGERILVLEPVGTGADFKTVSAKQCEWDPKTWQIDFQLTDDAARRFDSAASSLFHQSPKGQIAIVLDGKIHSRPVVHSEKFGGEGQVTGAFTQSQAEVLVAVFRSHPLPCPVRLETEEMVRPE